VVHVRGAGGGRVSIAGVVCYRPGDRPRLFYQLLVHRRRKGEPKGFTWDQYRDLIIAAHHQLGAAMIWCWDNLNIHLEPELADFAAENKDWLRIYWLPAAANRPAATSRNRSRRCCSAGVYRPRCPYRMPPSYTSRVTPDLYEFILVVAPTL